VSATRGVVATPFSVSTMLRLALRSPTAVGANVTLKLHVEPAGTLAPQVVVSVKSPGLGPPRVIELMGTALSPVVSVTVCGRLKAPTLSDWNTKPLGFRMIPFRMLILETKASQFPPELFCSGFASGKSREQV